ncbi:hypothetical protein F0245_15690 [Vibrio chagasii]|uniref:Uncharacterized protein n=1 Tax=Vibrio chagasii TaxID=170679 RepID=A0A7Y4DSY4_9VIBR|nr:hypothetical protein [Vibrio chagasii]
MYSFTSMLKRLQFRSLFCIRCLVLFELTQGTSGALLIPITVSKCSEIAQEKNLRTRQNFLVSSYSTIKNSNKVIEFFNKLG